MPGLTRESTSTRKPVHRALSVAVQYKDNPDGRIPYLEGTREDPPRLKQILTELLNFPKNEESANIVVLTDDNEDQTKRPTRENILREMHTLLEGAGPGDHFVFHFSGHGSQIPNTDHTEEDGMDELIWPVDVTLGPDGFVNEATAIKDDEIHKLVQNVPSGAHFMMIFDCCHSGTAADLPNSSASPKAVLSKGVRVHATVGDSDEDTVRDVTSWAACADNEVTFENEDGGMFLKAFYEALSEHRDATRGELLQYITEKLHHQFEERKNKKEAPSHDKDKHAPLNAEGASDQEEPVSQQFQETHPELGAEEDMDEALFEPVIDEVRGE